MNKRVNRVAGIAAALCACVFAGNIERIDLFDKAENHLLFVTFEYDPSGNPTGRSVYASDSTFLRSTTIQPGGATAATKEQSINYNGDPLFTTTINPPSAGTTSFSTVDQFGLKQFGSPLSYSETAANAFDVTQSNSTLCKEQYEFDASGDLTRITVLDNNGALAWYALVTQATAAVRPNRPLPGINPIRLTTNRGKIRLRVDLSEAGFVCAELFTPAGRKALSMVNKRIPSGTHWFTADNALLGNGTYVVKITINGVASLTRLIVVQK